MRTGCVLCEIGTEFLRSLWILTPETMVQFQAIQRQNVVDTVAVVQDFSSSTSVFPWQYHPSNAPYHLNLNNTLY